MTEQPLWQAAGSAQQPPPQPPPQQYASQQYPPQQYPAQQQGPAQHGHGAKSAAAPSRGLPVWIALVLVVLLAAAVLLSEPKLIKKSSAAAPAGTTPLPSQAVSTAVRPSSSNERVYTNPLPANIKPVWKPVDLKTDTNSTPTSYSGSWRPVTNAQYTAWVAHVRTQGSTPTPRGKNDATNYDLHKGHARLLGDYNSVGDGHVIFVYDPNGY